MNEASENTAPAQDVRRRHVLYIHGFDPAGARKYRELYRSEAALQAGISGYEIDVAGMERQHGNYRWSANFTKGGESCETVIEVLDWTDLAHKSMTRSIPQAIWTLITTSWFGTYSGAFTSWRRARPTIIIATFYPYLMLSLQILVGVILGVIFARLISAQLGLGNITYLGFVGIFAIAITALLMRFLKKYEIKTMIYYLLYIGDFAIQRGQYHPQDYVDREKDFANRIAEVLRSDVDEVLVVGHSAGTCLAVPVVADVLRRAEIDSSKLALLTLGQIIQYISFLPKAGYMRRDLHALAKHKSLKWVDVNAPSDGACFALTDPVSQSGVAPIEGQQTNPLVISAAFSLSLSKAWRNRKGFSYFKKHFQYLCAFDKPRDYDYFQITAGPISLKSRYKSRTNSKSVRYEKVSFYRDMSD